MLRPFPLRITEDSAQGIYESNWKLGVGLGEGDLDGSGEKAGFSTSKALPSPASGATSPMKYDSKINPTSHGLL